MEHFLKINVGFKQVLSSKRASCLTVWLNDFITLSITIPLIVVKVLTELHQMYP